MALGIKITDKKNYVSRPIKSTPLTPLGYKDERKKKQFSRAEKLRF